MGNKNQPEFENAISAPTMFFDFYLLNIPVSENSDKIYPSESNTNQSDKSGYPIRIFQVGVFKIESTGFKGLKHVSTCQRSLYAVRAMGSGLNEATITNSMALSRFTVFIPVR